ncbi:MAG: anhydro-N-acetylmuramic acid kinase [Betaproteobacteria bacterium]|nr:anhydro-N-acetylmuramic acid kinase [Betaproteobacteria bacterium]
MSGTSLDGVDAALLAFAPESSPSQAKFSLRATHSLPLPESLRDELLALQQPQPGELHRAALAANALAQCYAEAIDALLRKADMPAEAIRAVACHGQTIRHRPGCGYSLQLNNPALLSELCGIDVIADFRSRDIAAGGQGAPLVPAFHRALFAVAEKSRLIVNIGGMSNLSFVPPDGCPEEACFGFDCGPGNVLLDAWIQYCRGEAYDAGGAWAEQGRCLEPLLSRLLAHPFFALPPPKSCGREEFNLAWLKTLLQGNEDAADVQATLLDLTARGIAGAVRFCEEQGASKIREIYLCGGGAHNSALARRLAALLGKACSVESTQTLGLAPDWVEACAFAWLAREFTERRPANLPQATGARGGRILGALYPA